MDSISWQFYGLAIVVLAVPAVWVIRIIIRKFRGQHSQDHRAWTVEKPATSRLGKPVLNRTLYAGSLSGDIPWEMDAVTKEELTFYSHMNLENVPVFRTNFYTVWQTETALLDKDYVLIHPRNILEIYLNSDYLADIMSEKQTVEKLERFAITDMRRLFNLSIAKSEDLFRSMKKVVAGNQAFRRRFTTYATSSSAVDAVITPRLQAILGTWNHTDTCIGLSPGRTIILISGKDLSDQLPELERLAQLGELILPAGRRISSAA